MNASRDDNTRYTGALKMNPKYKEVLELFTSLLGIKGRRFDPRNRPVFGMSDGNKGIQWNIAIATDSEQVRLGVNLEGMKYGTWPIADFILSELDNPSIDKLKTKVEGPEDIYIRFKRDAWKKRLRQNIVEEYLNPDERLSNRELSLLEMNAKFWNSILTEALDCLDATRQYRGRGEQRVTLVNQPENNEVSMEVSPHLKLWTPIGLSGDIEANLRKGFAKLKPVYEWVALKSKSIINIP